MALLPGFVGLGGTSKRVKNLATGEEMSRRQYVQRYLTNGVSLEKRSKENAIKNPEAHYSKTARGRKSLKSIPEKERIAGIEKRAKQDFEKRLKRELAKKEKVKKFKPSNLKPGASAYRSAFYTYQDYQTLLRDAQKSGKVFSYALGITGVDERDLRRLDAFMSPLRDIKSEFSHSRFTELVNQTLDEKSYFLPRHFWIHFHFKSEYVKQRAKTAKKKKNP